MAPARLKKKLLESGKRKSKNNRTTTKKKTVAKKKRSTSKKKYTKASSSRNNNIPVPVPAPVADNDNNNNNNGPTVVGPLEAKVEFSPNGMAKCKSCFKKIEKKSKRFGIPLYSPRFNQEIYCYYHLQCCPEHIRNTIPNFRQKLSQQEQIENEKVHTLHYRKELVQSLKVLRLTFANRLKVSPCLVFSNDVLNEIVVVLPDTQHELSNVRGIGPTKLKSFGSAILSLIRQYNNKQKQKRIQIVAAARKNGGKKKPSTSTNNSSNNNNPKRKKDPPPQEVIVIDDSDDDDNDDDIGRRTAVNVVQEKNWMPTDDIFDYQCNANANSDNNNNNNDEEEEEEIAIGVTLTCEQLVEQKFDHAAKNGYIIAIDI